MSKAKIAIVGAGPAGLSTAFFLTDPATNPNWADRYEVDVYQLGWRVGGKGATTLKLGYFSSGVMFAL